MKKGILGGTFNPIHNAHLELAKAAKEQFDLDMLIFMPSKKPAYKSNKDIISEEHRLNMCQLAADYLGGAKKGYFASDFEYKREGNTYTYETLTLLKDADPDDEIYFIIGADSLINFTTWKKPEEIIKRCTLLVAGRDGISNRNLKHLARRISRKYKRDIYVIDFKQMDISSTMLRESMADKSTEESAYFPEPIYDYIKKNQLYGF